MAVYLATKTIEAIDEAVKADQGAKYRGFLEQVMPHIGDAYSTKEDPFRTHMGASGIGDECARKIWYSFHWVTRQQHEGRLLRLFNRGHMEEARFIALLLTIGCTVYQQDEHGNQYKISDAGGHFGGSGDGVVIGCPDVPAETPILSEFKTSAEKIFLKIKKEGVRSAKFEHFVQMNVYMRKMGLSCALYMVVNKNNDELYGEIVMLDTSIADQFIDRGCNLVFQTNPPNKINKSPGWYQCSWCDHKPVCHLKAAPDRNCRTCHFSYPDEDGTWKCTEPEIIALNNRKYLTLSKELQFTGCDALVNRFPFGNIIPPLWKHDPARLPSRSKNGASLVTLNMLLEPACAMPTGTGKSIVIADLLRTIFYNYPNQRVIMATHVKELIEQNLDKLLRVWKNAPAGVYSAGLNRRDVNERIILAGIGSVAKRAQEFGHVDLLLIDEAHLVSPNQETMYRKFINDLTTINPMLKVIGLTAYALEIGAGALNRRRYIHRRVF